MYFFAEREEVFIAPNAFFTASKPLSLIDNSISPIVPYVRTLWRTKSTGSVSILSASMSHKTARKARLFIKYIIAYFRTIIRYPTLFIIRTSLLLWATRDTKVG